VFVDESGDLGLSLGASKSITICAVATGSRARFERMPRRIRRNRLGRSVRDRPELKFYNSTPRMREFVLEPLVAFEDVRIVALTLFKREFGDRITSDPDGFYRLLCGALVEDLPWVAVAPGRISAVFDARRGRRSRGVEFDRHMVSKIQEGYANLGLIVPDVIVSRFDSHNSGGLQMAGFAAGAIHRRHESGDAHYSGMIARAVVFEGVCKRL
jgi:hypothetical protein